MSTKSKSSFTLARAVAASKPNTPAIKSAQKEKKGENNPEKRLQIQVLSCVSSPVLLNIYMHLMNLCES